MRDFTDKQAVGAAKAMTKAQRQAARRRRNHQDLAPATRRALAAQGLIVIHGSGRWHWTPLGRRTIQHLEEE